MFGIESRNGVSYFHKQCTLSKRCVRDRSAGGWGLQGVDPSLASGACSPPLWTLRTWRARRRHALRPDLHGDPPAASSTGARSSSSFSLRTVLVIAAIPICPRGAGRGPVVGHQRIESRERAVGRFLDPRSSLSRGSARASRARLLCRGHADPAAISPARASGLPKHGRGLAGAPDP